MLQDDTAQSPQKYGNHIESGMMYLKNEYDIRQYKSIFILKGFPTNRISRYHQHLE